MPLNYILVDPNPIKRLHLIQVLKKIKNLNLVDEFSNAVEAQNFLDYNSVDLIFLSAQLPVYSGFDFIEKLKDPTEIVLMTEEADDALRAFDLNLADCISPPFSLERIAQSVSRIEQKIKVNQSILNKVDEFIEIKHNLKTEKIAIDHIQWIEAVGDYVKIITSKKKFIVLSTMKNFLNRLPEEQFLRIHKSYIINLKKVINYSASSVNIENKDFPLSRTQKKHFRLTVSKFQ
jgi:two-component system, LytTR family, response regulator